METLKQLDEQLFVYLNQFGGGGLDSFWLTITNQWMSIPIYGLLSLLILWKTGFKSTVIHMFFIGGLVVSTLVISRLFKYGVARPRPCNPLSGLENVYYPLKKDCGDFGFFSTHASVGMALMLYIGKVLKPYFKYILWPLMIWVGLFCYSRIYVGKHYPGDIVVGLLIGFIMAILFLNLRKWVQKKYQA